MFITRLHGNKQQYNDIFGLDESAKIFDRSVRTCLLNQEYQNRLFEKYLRTESDNSILKAMTFASITFKQMLKYTHIVSVKTAQKFTFT